MAEQEKNFLQQLINWGGQLAAQVGWPLTGLIVLVAVVCITWWSGKTSKSALGLTGSSTGPSRSTKPQLGHARSKTPDDVKHGPIRGFMPAG
jgi:hypothetical protein